MKIVIASDSFKGSLTSLQVANAVCDGVKAVYPSAEIVKLNLADGGEGTVETIVASLGGDLLSVEVSDPLGRPVNAVYGLVEDGSLAVMEMSSASGLTLLTQEERNPLLTSTYGTGEMIRDAINRGCRKFCVGIGGSATNDGGMGMLAALGYRFYDAEGRILDAYGAALRKIAYIDDSAVIPELLEAEFTVACDVDNPFFGTRGAAHVFSPQKGADMAMVEILDKGLEHFAGVIVDYNGRDVSTVAGVGAAGGLGGAFLAFLNAKLVSGIDMVLDIIHFDEIIDGADLLITGEGRIDSQTAMGKTAMGVLKRAATRDIPVVALGGSVEMSDSVEALGFDEIVAVTPPDMSVELAMRPSVASANITSAVQQLLLRYSCYF